MKSARAEKEEEEGSEMTRRRVGGRVASALRLRTEHLLPSTQKYRGELPVRKRLSHSCVAVCERRVSTRVRLRCEADGDGVVE